MSKEIPHETPESSYYWSQTYMHMQCPHCKKDNTINLGNLDDYTVPDIQACQCFSCDKKFWLPGYRELIIDELGYDGETTANDLGLEPGQDLIEYAYCEKGRK